MGGVGACWANFKLKLDGVFDLDGVGSRNTWTSSSIDARRVNEGYLSVITLSSA